MNYFKAGANNNDLCIYEVGAKDSVQYNLLGNSYRPLSCVGLNWFEAHSGYIKITKEEFDNILVGTKKTPLTLREKILAAF